MFSINPVTGTVNTTKILDRELIPIHYFQVIATDNGHPKRNDFSYPVLGQDTIKLAEIKILLFLKQIWLDVIIAPVSV
jgi:hypothetical protein